MELHCKVDALTAKVDKVDCMCEILLAKVDALTARVDGPMNK